ncbi:MAG TPA: lysyl oxidase family protein [Thermoanaerobaculia bacterium]|jgi:hypothetical protein|nr:lysyl oxidase family protein [Thermoanaerobaculia bacterium]HEV8610944.1 lysyl oxidase family protein [Thermoanaerobaculia bacterium]
MFKTWRGGPALVSFLLGFGLVFANAGSAIAEHSANALLPDLAMLQPNEFHLELGSGGVRLLRFSTSIVNLGPGRFDVYGSEPDPADSTKLTRVTQRLEQDGVWVEHPTAATMFYSGDGHNHWHVFGLQDWKLAFQATPNDRIASAAKTGFCFWDNVNLSNADKYYTGFRECHLQSDGTVPMGLSVNWGDKYPWSIAFQYIDISTLPYGNYCLTVTADPRGEFVEARTDNNSVRTLIAIQPDAVTVLAPDCTGESPARIVHVADLDGTVKAKGKSGKWEAFVTATIRDSAGSPVGGATVTGNWSGAASRSVSGLTASNGSVTLGTGQIAGGTNATFTVTNVAGAGLTYSQSANTDPDGGDSTGTTITISKP